MGVNVAFALLPWGPLRASVPDKWLLLVTAVGAPQDSDAAYKTRHQYTASTTEASHTATGSVGKTCQRAHTTTGEQQPTTTRPQPTSRPAPAPKPQPPQGEPTSPGETDQSSYMQSSAKTSRAMPGKASSQDTEAGRDCQRQQRGQLARAAAMARLWLRQLAATLQGGRHTRRAKDLEQLLASLDEYNPRLPGHSAKKAPGPGEGGRPTWAKPAGGL